MINSKEILKNDIEDMFKKLNDLCHCSCWDQGIHGNIEIKLKDFRPYRNTINSIIRTFDGLNRVCNYNLLYEDKDYLMRFISNIEDEIKRVNGLKEICKENNEQYRCLQDAYITLTNTLSKVYRSNKMQKETFEIEDCCGLKDKNKVHAIKETLKHENQNLKAIVMTVKTEDMKNGNINIKSDYIIPFTSIEKAQEYIDTELKLLDIPSLLIKINE